MNGTQVTVSTCQRWHTTLCVCALLPAAVALAETRYVPDDHATIQACIDAAVSGSDECVVAAGTYHEAIDFNGKAIAVRSLEGADVTTIHAGWLTRSVVKCVSGEGPGTVLDGFTLTGGTGTASGGFRLGGGMYVSASSPTVLRCTFVGNSASKGGGIHIADGSAPTVTHCRFFGNTGQLGGGMYNLNNSDSNVTHCLFSGNTAGFGGGMINTESHPTLTNCSFSRNTATYSGGAIYNCLHSGPTVVNSVLWGSSPDEINTIPFEYGMTIRHSIIEGGLLEGGGDGGGNLAGNPLFEDADGADEIVGTIDDDLRLSLLSPGIDAGDNAAVAIDFGDLDGDSIVTERVPLDLAGQMRFTDVATAPQTGVAFLPDYASIADIGALEAAAPPCVGADDCNDGDVCTHGTCGAGECGNAPRPFGDANADALVDIFDILCVLDGFSGNFNGPCARSNVDLAPCPGGDGAIDVFDILGALDGFAGVDACGCSAAGS
ncbi:MAG: right-handed parallel beta-helix repeat-containing protein [Phycisphaerales bacterium]|nr:right-handed parallel beta-helix repeat-containing protein [Phycisphaerales bacterium]